MLDFWNLGLIKQDYSFSIAECSLLLKGTQNTLPEAAASLCCLMVRHILHCPVLIAEVPIHSALWIIAPCQFFLIYRAIDMLISDTNDNATDEPVTEPEKLQV